MVLQVVVQMQPLSQSSSTKWATCCPVSSQGPAAKTGVRHAVLFLSSHFTQGCKAPAHRWPTQEASQVPRPHAMLRPWSHCLPVRQRHWLWVSRCSEMCEDGETCFRVIQISLEPAIPAFTWDPDQGIGDWYPGERTGSPWRAKVTDGGKPKAG